MGANMLLALACVFFVMASLFESLLYPLVVMGTVPFASLGVFWLMMATGTPFNLMAMIGMVILIGIVVNNGIVLVDHINNLRRAGWSLDRALVEGCGDRMRPILMTAGTTILGLLPLAVLGGAHVGDAEYYPMARAISGGLASSTLLTLLVMPTYYRLATVWTAGLAAAWRTWTGRPPAAAYPARGAWKHPDRPFQYRFARISKDGYLGSRQGRRVDCEGRPSHWFTCRIPRPSRGRATKDG